MTTSTLSLAALLALAAAVPGRAAAVGGPKAGAGKSHKGSPRRGARRRVIASVSRVVDASPAALPPIPLLPPSVIPWYR